MTKEELEKKKLEYKISYVQLSADKEEIYVEFEDGSSLTITDVPDEIKD
jgi:hypothetical protein